MAFVVNTIRKCGWFWNKIKFGFEIARFVKFGEHFCFAVRSCIEGITLSPLPLHKNFVPSPPSSEIFKMAASAAQTRVKEEVERSLENLERDHLRKFQASSKSSGGFLVECFD